MMPRLNGLAVLQAVRKNNDVPLIILTALSDEEDKLKGYELGADDYVTKPFSLSVLYAKTMALIRRNERKVLSSGQLIAGGITLDLLEKKRPDLRSGDPAYAERIRASALPDAEQRPGLKPGSAAGPLLGI